MTRKAVLFGVVVHELKISKSLCIDMSLVMDSSGTSWSIADNFFPKKLLVYPSETQRPEPQIRGSNLGYFFVRLGPDLTKLAFFFLFQFDFSQIAEVHIPQFHFFLSQHLLPRISRGRAEYCQ